MFLLRFLVCHYKVMNHFHWSWADLSSPKEANVIVGEKRLFTCYSGLCGVWFLIWTQTSGSPATCAQYALLLCGSPCGEGLASHFKAAQWQVSREIGAFCLGWWNIILFWEGCCFRGCFSELWGPWAVLHGKGRLASIPAVSPWAVLPCDTAENSLRSSHPCPHFPSLSWDLAMLISSPSALGNGQEVHSLVYPLLPFEFWCWLPLLATPLGFAGDINSNTTRNVYFGLSPAAPKKEHRYFCCTISEQFSLWTGLLFHL